MKTRIISVLAVCLLMLPLGCATATAPTPPTAPGFSSQADQTMDQVLVGARTFYVSIQKKVTAGTYTPSASEKTALNTFASALNTAESVYLAYHNGTATQAQAQTAVDSVSAQQTTLQATITTGGK